MGNASLSETYVQNVANLFGKDVKVLVNRHPDLDLCDLVMSDLFIKGGGGFSAAVQGKFILLYRNSHVICFPYHICNEYVICFPYHICNEYFDNEFKCIMNEVVVATIVYIIVVIHRSCAKRNSNTKIKK